MLVHILIKGEVGAVKPVKPPVKYFTDRSKAVRLLWILYVVFCLVFAMPLYRKLYHVKKLFSICVTFKRHSDVTK